jgi:hypothetical protein
MAKEGRIENEFHTDRVERSLRGYRAPSQLRWLGNHGILQWKQPKSSFAVA